MARQEQETWRNISAGKHGVLKYDRYGVLRQELVRSGQTIQLTKDEREINMEKAASARLDLFQNGILQPVKLLDEADQATFASNPNYLSEAELKDLFKLQWQKFDSRVQDIESPVTLQRLYDIATDEEADLATARQIKILEDALEVKVGKQKAFPSAAEQATRGITPVTPR